MNDYVLTCCSTADLSKEYFSSRDIKVIFFHFELDGKDYLDDCGESIPPEVLFDSMKNGADTKTSQVSVGEYIEFWTEFLDDGKDILHISFSSGLSGTYNSALVAKNSLSDKYPDRKILVVDSLGASSGYGLIMDTLADMRDDGKGIDELHDWVEENKLRMHHWFYSTDLSFYIRGGRVSKTAGVFGQLLSICPPPLKIILPAHGYVGSQARLPYTLHSKNNVKSTDCSFIQDYERPPDQLIGRPLLCIL